MNSNLKTNFKVLQYSVISQNYLIKFSILITVVFLINLEYPKINLLNFK